VLGEGSLASVAYGEIGSSLYFALGVVAAYALGLTPWVLLGIGCLFLLVAFSYAEGTTAIAEPGGAATFVRRAFNDPAGFVTGWVLFLDYLIVIALAALFVPHYVAAALHWDALAERPADMLAAIGVILAVAVVRLARRVAIYTAAIAVAAIAFVTHVGLIVFGGIYLFSADSLREGTTPGVAPTWYDLAFALPLAMLAFTGIETVANLAAEAREPGKTLPRGIFAGIAAVVVAYVAVSAVGLSAYPARDGTTELGTTWLHAPLVGIAAALPDWLSDMATTAVGISGGIVLLAAITTSISGAGRLALSLARYGMLPHRFAVLSPRSLLPPVAIVAAAVTSAVLLAIAWAAGDEVRFLASLYSFGILIALTAAQLAVVRLRRKEPDLPRPFRAPGMPYLGVAGAVATAAILVASLATHDAARVGGPIWLLLGIGLFIGVRGRHALEHARAAVPDLAPEVEAGEYGRILVPLKAGPIGDEVLATALRLAEEQSARVLALNVIKVGLDRPLDAPLPDEEGLARAALAELRNLAAEHGVQIETRVVQARSIGAAIVEQAGLFRADLILVGSSPRWRRQSRFFSPSVEYVLRKARCEVMVVAYPQGVLEEAYL
jgi:basic amino acid/polyamine antiporter, APA family